jgi:hypothetical protein
MIANTQMNRLLFFFFAIALFGTAVAQEKLQKWESFDYRHKLIKPADLQGLDDEELAFLRGVVFGRHGRVFRDVDIVHWLEEQEWFKPNPKFKNSMLNDIERKNLDVIREAESKAHKHIQPGDMRFWRTRAFTKDQVGEKTLMDLHVMRAEIEAIHGRTFPEEPKLQQYFEDRYWYKAAKRYDPKGLTATERENIATLQAMEKEQRQLGLQPGDMLAFQRRLITPKMLDNLSIHELRLLRNEVYALRGHKFKTQWLADTFASYEWYKPASRVKLNPFEEKNVALILKKETEIHDGLTSKPVTQDLLDGLWLEDVQRLRNEIYARHGKIFRSKWMQSYFESFPWYKRNPKYSEKLLTKQERDNLKVIFGYESSAESQFNQTEG